VAVAFDAGAGVCPGIEITATDNSATTPATAVNGTLSRWLIEHLLLNSSVVRFGEDNTINELAIKYSA
jgi:hypothetical protein